MHELGIAQSLLDLGVDQLSVDAALLLNATVNTAGRAGFVFDRYAADAFKFVAIDAARDQVIIGHYTAKTGWVNDAVVSKLIDAGTDYSLGLSLKGSTVSVTLDGQSVAGYVYNAVTVDGHFGLISSAGQASFDDLTVKTSDRAFAAVAAGSSATASTAMPAQTADGSLALMGTLDADLLQDAGADPGTTRTNRAHDLRLLDWVEVPTVSHNDSEKDRRGRQEAKAPTAGEPANATLAVALWDDWLVIESGAGSPEEGV